MVGSLTKGEVMGTPGTKIEWTTKSTGKEPQLANDKNDKVLEEDSGDTVVDFSEMLGDTIFLGEFPFDAITEGIEEQFEDYINLEDKNNYMDIFYNQLYSSYEAVRADDSEEHPTEIIEALDKIHEDFIDKVVELFDKRLTIHFPSIEAATAGSSNDTEFILRRTYEFFILGAKDNFKTVITADIIPRVKDIVNDNEYFRTVNELMEMYSPLITNIQPEQFLKYRNDIEMIELFENNQISGNFLRKYSPKFYQNDDFMVEVINHITMIQQFKMDLLESTESFNNSDISEETKTMAEQRVYEYGEDYEYEYEIGPYVD